MTLLLKLYSTVCELSTISLYLTKTLRHIELCNSVISQKQQNRPKLFLQCIVEDWPWEFCVEHSLCGHCCPWLRSPRGFPSPGTSAWTPTVRIHHYTFINYFHISTIEKCLFHALPALYRDGFMESKYNGDHSTYIANIFINKTKLQ